MYYRSGTAVWCRHCVHSPGGCTFRHEMAAWLPSWMCDIKSKIWLSQILSIDAYLLKEHSCKI